MMEPPKALYTWGMTSLRRTTCLPRHVLLEQRELVKDALKETRRSLVVLDQVEMIALSVLTMTVSTDRATGASS